MFLEEGNIETSRVLILREESGSVLNFDLFGHFLKTGREKTSSSCLFDIGLIAGFKDFIVLFDEIVSLLKFLFIFGVEEDWPVSHSRSHDRSLKNLVDI